MSTTGAAVAAKCDTCSKSQVRLVRGTCVECLKNKGDSALQDDKAEDAVRFYDAAIHGGKFSEICLIKLEEPSAHLYSNRAAALSKLNRFQEALSDAEKCIQMNPSWQKGYSRKATALMGLQRIPECLDAFVCALRLDTTSDFLKNAVVEVFVERLYPHQPKETTESPFECTLCFSLFVEPITLDCGHTFCRDCLIKYSPSSCHKCGKGYKKDIINVHKPNIILSNLLPKQFTNEYNALAIKKEGNKFYTSNKYQDALLMYSKAITIAPQLAVLYSNRSVVLSKMNLLEEALLDASKAIDLKPQWAKGYIRKASILCQMNRYEEALLEVSKGALANSSLKIPHTAELKQLLEELLPLIALNVQNFSICAIVSNLPSAMEEDANMNQSKKSLTEIYDLQDLTCTLCFELYFDPVTTVCGHSFCRQCLSRSLDHNNTCPICRASLPQVISRQSTDTTLQNIVQSLFPEQYKEREETIKKELEEQANNIPIFVCTLLFPFSPLPLHIFEPRYRLMLRRCLESGYKRFGMVTYTQNGFAEYGTIAEIKDVQMLPDGRSLVNTVGSKRFKIKDHWMKDNYLVANVSWIEDDPTSSEDEVAIAAAANKLKEMLDTFLQGIPAHKRLGFFQHYGQVPEDPSKISFYFASFLPIHDTHRLPLLKMTNLRQRIEKTVELMQIIMSHE